MSAPEFPDCRRQTSRRRIGSGRIQAIFTLRIQGRAISVEALLREFVRSVSSGNQAGLAMGSNFRKRGGQRVDRPFDAETEVERRRSTRLGIADTVSILPARTGTFTAIDISLEGIGLVGEADEPPMPDTEVNLALLGNSISVLGRVRRCVRQRDGSYLIGIEFQRNEPEVLEVLVRLRLQPEPAGDKEPYA